MTHEFRLCKCYVMSYEASAFLLSLRMVYNYTEPISANQGLSKNSSVNNYQSSEAIPQFPLIYLI